VFTLTALTKSTIQAPACRQLLLNKSVALHAVNNVQQDATENQDHKWL